MIHLIQGVTNMANLRTLVVLEPPIKKLVREKARSEGVSISSVCRDLIHDALEIYEDGYWDAVAGERGKRFKWDQALSHEQVWKHSRNRR